jgi:hypothetical protein
MMARDRAASKPIADASRERHAGQAATCMKHAARRATRDGGRRGIAVKRDRGRLTREAAPRRAPCQGDKPMLRADLSPSRPNARGGRLRRLLPAGLLCLGLAAPCGVTAQPGVEYGPEVEGIYLFRCIGTLGQKSLAECQREMERMQAELGYEGFMQRAAADAARFRQELTRSATGSDTPGVMAVSSEEVRR